jgi:serine/threonine-protein kinase HipA
MTIAEVRLWGSTIGAVVWDAAAGVARFEYDQGFQQSGIELSPLVMPLASRVYAFPSLSRDSFHGLPGLLADSLPDDFGNALIDAWLAREGRGDRPLDPVERLCYTGTRGMGALEYHPILGPRAAKAERIDLDALVDLAGEILAQRNQLTGSFAPLRREESLQTILRVGTSAGGARAKAIIAWNPETDEVRSGQVDAGSGFTYWLLKFDGVRGGGGATDRGRELDDPAGYGRIEHAYHHMAVAAGITMSECRLLEESGRCHFMTRRFDRTPSGRKLHMQSLGALAHLDYRQAGAHSYEQALLAIRRLGLPMDALEEQLRRAAFNIVARNQDDHVKNIAFLMDRAGRWSLSPAFDLTYSYNPAGAWTRDHQMTLNAKRDGFTRGDFRECAKLVSIARGRADDIVDQVTGAVKRWPEFAAASGVPEEVAGRIAGAQRRELGG